MIRAVGPGPTMLTGSSGGYEVGALRLETPLYWAETVEFSGRPALSCDGERVPLKCVEYRFSVVAQGDRLRVGFDRHRITDAISLELLDCTGTLCSVTVATEPAYSAELVARSPQPGLWKLRVRRLPSRTTVNDPPPETGERRRYRAKLEKVSRPEPRGESLRPNMIAEPPFEVSFQEPSTGQNCLPDERSTGRHTTCLRMGLGAANTGRGPLHLRFEPFDKRDPRPSGGNVTQVIGFDDPSRQPHYHPAGRYEYHLTHQHFHWLGYAALQLFAVEGRRLVPKGASRKLGFCLGDGRIADWSSFEQDETDNDSAAQARRCLGPPNPDRRLPQHWQADMRQTRGWTDIYDLGISGNYIDFSGPDGRPLPSGRYVVRMTVDPDDHVLETDDADNVGYAYLDVATRVPVTATIVTILERGRGLDPWDADKQILPWDDRSTTTRQ